MRKSLKKVLSVLSVAALVASTAMYNVQAASITTITVNGGTTLAANAQVTTVTFTPATTLTDGSSVVVSYPSTMSDASLVAADIDVTNGATDLTEGTIVVDTSANTITIPVTTAGTALSPVTLTFSNAHLAAPANGTVSFGVNTSVGDVGAVAVYVANSNVATVAATVVPTLTMTLDSNSLAFGTLDTTVKTAQSGLGNAYLQVGVATNADGGAIVTMSSANNGALKDGAKTIVADANGLVAGTPGVSYNTANKSGNSTIADGTYLDLTDGSDPILNTNSDPSNNQTVQVVATATIDSTTPAGNYADTLTFTASGSF